MNSRKYCRQCCLAVFLEPIVDDSGTICIICKNIITNVLIVASYLALS
jgi:hypothetical protein